MKIVKRDERYVLLYDESNSEYGEIIWSPEMGYYLRSNALLTLDELKKIVKFMEKLK